MVKPKPVSIDRSKLPLSSRDEYQNALRKIEAVALTLEANGAESGLDARELEDVVAGCFRMTASAVQDLKRLAA